MKFYNVDKLFIGYVGYARLIYKNNKQYNRFEPEEITIVKQKEYSSNYYFFDIISNKKYIDFYNVLCCSGDTAILKPKSLSLFIDQEKDLVQGITEIEAIVNKIKKGKKISDKDIKLLIYNFNKKLKDDYIYHQNNDNEENNHSKKNKSEQELDFNYSTILTDKIFKNEPAIGRDKEVYEVILTLAQDKKNPILVGPSGTGKTTIVDQIAHKIQTNEVPDFLKKKKIIELDLTNLLAGTKFSGTLEEKITKIIDFAIKKEAIIFIDEIHSIYGAGTHNNSDYDIAAMIKYAIDRQGLKVIGTTTTEEYDKYFSNDALKRRFEKILVYEPTDIILYQIVDKIFMDYSKNNNIKIFNNMNKIINTLIELTNKNNRTWDDNIHNPDLVISIIDRIFADAKIHNQEIITIGNILYAIKSCNRIYDGVKEKFINNLNTEAKENEKAKIIQLKMQIK